MAMGDRRAVLVGRAGELRELEDALWHVRATGAARIVTILGATGIGKTRLVRDFLVKMRGSEKDSPRVFRGSARDQGAAYGVFARVLRARFGIVEGMDREAAKAQVRAQVAAVLEDRKVGDVAYFLGQLLDLDFQDSPLIKAVRTDPAQMKSLRRAIIKNFLEADAKGKGPLQGPLVLLFDDLHFAHDESLDLLENLLETLEGQILIICIARPEMMARRDGWLRHGGDRHSVIELSPLSDVESSQVMRDLLAPCGDSDGVDDLVDAACTLAGGNPALLEQMVRIFHDMGVLEVHDDFAEEERWTIHVDALAHVKLPLTVEDAVQARISALAPAERELLERAAMMGGVFWLGGLVAIHRLDGSTPDIWAAGDTHDIVHIKELLKELVERDYILKLPDSTFPADEEFVFKHNLERETLVKLTSSGAQKRYHAAISDYLSFKEHVKTHEEYVGMLARHLEKAGNFVRAAQSYLQAADVARERYANAKAAEYYVKGLTLLRAGAESSADGRIRALHHYGDVLQALGRNDEALNVFRDMLTDAFKLDLRAKGGAAHSRIGRLFRETGRLDDASHHLNAALALFEGAQDDRGIASTVDDIGKLHWLRGDYAKALESTQRALAMRRKIGDRRSIALSLNNLGLVYQDSGQFKLALEAFEQALRIRREIGDLVGVSISLNNLGTVAQDQRDDRRALELFEEAYDVAEETGDRNRIALILTNLGETHNRLGNPNKAIEFLKRAEGLADELGDKLGLAEAVRGLGKAYLAQRDYVKARDCTARAVEIFREIQSKVQLGVALRSLGEVVGSHQLAAAVGASPGEALKASRGYLLHSIVIFEEIGNEVELARSCRAYAELLRSTPEIQVDPQLEAEATEYARRADDIFAKLKISSYGLEPDAHLCAKNASGGWIACNSGAVACTNGSCTPVVPR
jgi:tetratricopeptide (TPR) repeat protein